MRLDHLLSKESKVFVLCVFKFKRTFTRKRRDAQDFPFQTRNVRENEPERTKVREDRIDRIETQYGKEKTSIWGISSVGRAPALHAGGQEFESLILHHI